MIAGLTVLSALFAVNFALFLWGESERNDGLRELDAALQRQLLIASIRQRLQDVHREMTLRGEIQAGGRNPDESAWLRNQIEAVRREIAQARALSRPDSVGDLHDVRRTFEDLAQSWTVAYERLGVDDAGAITELSLHAEPLAATVLGPLMREWENRERARAEAARGTLAGVRRVVYRVTLTIFAVSSLIAIGVVAGLWRSFARTPEGDAPPAPAVRAPWPP